MFCPALIVKIILKKGPLNVYQYISFFDPKIFLNLFYTFFTWGNFKQLANAQHLKSTHPTVQCTQDISEVHTHTI